MRRLSEILNHSAQAYPNHIALDDPGLDSLSYHQLYDRCEQVKAYLKKSSIGRGDRIGILLPKSIDSVTAILGTLSIEAAYVPVDAHASVNRAAYIFNDARVKAIVVDDSLLADFVSVFEDNIIAQHQTEFSFHLLVCQYSGEDKLEMPDDLAYMLYTSGSTGTPKGVMITHRNALCFIEWCAACFQTHDQDVFSSMAPFHFDLSIFDLYVSLLSGAKLVLFNQKAAKNPLLLAKYIGEKCISIIYATPTLLKLIVRFGKPDRHDHSAIRTILFAGEVFAIQDLKNAKAAWNTAQFFNLYGPTETNVVTWHPIPGSISDEITTPFPIGKACPYTECKIWKDNMLLEVRSGVKGELIVKGESVAYGYLNLPEKTKHSFMDFDGEIWYRTGDLVEVDEDLDFIFIDRIDRMVKRNGYRIELAELENVLHRHPTVAQVGVVAYKNEKEELKIKAFLSVAEEKELPNAFDLKQFCLEHLPMYMLPDFFIPIDQFPKTSTHKIDYQRLKQM